MTEVWLPLRGENDRGSHTAAKQLFKVTLENDEKPKGA